MSNLIKTSTLTFNLNTYPRQIYEIRENKGEKMYFEILCGQIKIYEALNLEFNH